MDKLRMKTLDAAEGNVMGMKMKRASVWMSVGGEMLWFSVGFEVSEVVGREKRNVQKVEFALIRVEFWGPSV